MENHIRALRAERGWSQAKLAELIGSSRQTVGSIEAGRSDPSLSLALEIAAAFGVTVEDVFSKPAKQPPWQRAPQSAPAPPPRA